MPDPFVKQSIKDSISTIEFYHPAHNSLPGQLLSVLVEEINTAGDNKDVNLVILKSSGDRSFCAGASFEELLAIQNPSQGKKFFMGFARLINAMRKCPKLILARIQGKAVGGAVGIAAAADYCMATKYASVKLSELALGIGPFVIGPAVERKIGLSAFSQLAINATEWKTAEWAKQKGLFAEVFISTSQLDAYIEHFSKNLASMSPSAMLDLKNIFWKGTEEWDDMLAQRAEISGNLIMSEHAKNAIHSLKSKGS